jgi:hypothetical protein
MGKTGSGAVLDRLTATLERSFEPRHQCVQVTFHCAPENSETPKKKIESSGPIIIGHGDVPSWNLRLYFSNGLNSAAFPLGSNAGEQMMKRKIGCTATAVALATILSASLAARDKPDAVAPEAMKALDQMGAYLRTLKDFEVKAEITTEDVLEDGQKLQYASTTTLLAQVPSKMRVSTEGELKSRLFLYDGKSFTVFARRVMYYATVPAPDTIGKLIEVLSNKYDVEIPLVDLFLWGGPNARSKEITAAADFGPGTVEGMTCEHYAFRQPGLDWQVWIQLGDHPLPRKLILTTTTDEARPQHTSILTWNLAPSYSEDAFVFNPPAGAHKIVFAEEKASEDGSK